MDIRQFAAAVALGAATLFTGVQSADAARAVITDSVNIRSGPGTEYRVVGRAERGDRVNVTRCTQSRRWCHVERRRGRDGWVSTRYLGRWGGGGGGGYGHGHNRPGSICFHGAGGYICLTP